MFTLDERIRGIPVAREQVVSLFQSINAPQLAVPGKQMGAAQGYVVGVRGPQGFAVFIYLHLSELGDCAVYASERRALPAEEYSEEEATAVAFAESMGFMLDNLNFRGAPVEQQDEWMQHLPCFQRAPPGATGAAPVGRPSGAEAPQREQVVQLGRIFSAF
jgi:hypothetical protein